MCIYGMWQGKVPKWPWFWAEVAVKARRDLATLVKIYSSLWKEFLTYF
jgi:hypothetical protein